MQVFEGRYYKTVSGEKVGPMRGDGEYCVRTDDIVRSWDRKTGERLYRKNAPADDIVEEWQEPTSQGPVRTKTVKEIVPGEYARFYVSDPGEQRVGLSLEHSITHYFNAEELHAAALVLTQLAEALEK